MDDGQVKQIQVAEAKKAMEENPDAILLDVRTPEEFERARIKGSINLPVDQVAHKVKEIIPDTEKVVYVYCLSGSRSPYAVAVMTKLGYKKVFDMINGLLAWRALGYEIEK